MIDNTITVYAILDRRTGLLTTPEYGKQRRTVYQRLSSTSQLCNRLNEDHRIWYADPADPDEEPYEVVTTTIIGNTWETIPNG